MSGLVDNGAPGVSDTRPAPGYYSNLIRFLNIIFMLKCCLIMNWFIFNSRLNINIYTYSVSLMLMKYILNDELKYTKLLPII